MGPDSNSAASASRSVDCAISPRHSNSSRMPVPMTLIFPHALRVMTLDHADLPLSSPTDSPQGFDESFRLFDMRNVAGALDDEEGPTMPRRGQLGDPKGDHSILATPKQCRRHAEARELVAGNGFGLG